jgi:RNA polymerase sigma-70 factor (ECF subfamily)
VETVALVDRREALARHMEQDLDRSYRLARAILADDREAEDAVQDACLAAWRRSDTLRDVDRFEAWFERILVNVCRDRLRGRQRQRVRAIALADAARGAGERLEPDPAARGDDPDLDRAFDQLEAEQRTVVLLRYWRDLTVDDIAERLNVPAGTVKSRLHYALRSLRESLEATHGRA